MIVAANAIASFLTGSSREVFLQDVKTRSAVLQQLAVIGEAASQLPPAVRHRHPAVEWGAIIGFRNVAVHAYFTVDWVLVWEAATLDVPPLARQIAAILDEEFPATGRDDGEREG